MSVGSMAFVGTTGGAGTTRTTVELGGVLARAGRSTLVLDLDFATQGLSRFVDGRIDPDATALLAEENVPLSECVHGVPVEGEGRLDLLPSFAPFSGIADAKTSAAGARVGERLDDAGEAFDHVLLDVPPVVSNQAVGGVTAAEAVAAVIPPTDRGVAALQRERGRMADVGTEFDHVIAVGTDAGGAPPDADHRVPALPGDAPANGPITLESTGPYTARLAEIAGALFDDDDLGSAVDAKPGLLDRLSHELRN